MGNLFWDVATSDFALSVDALVLLAALVVGFVPFGKYMPVIGPYIPVARLIAALVALLICFLVGFRVADERDEKRTLRAIAAAQSADLETSRSAEADANQRASDIEKGADDQRKADDETISKLTLAAGCGFEPFPDRVRKDGAAPAAPGPRSAVDAAKADDAAGGPGDRSAMPLSVVRRRWLPWERP